MKFIKEAEKGNPPISIAYRGTKIPTPNKNNSFALIVSLAKAGKTESQIVAAVQNEYGPLSNHLTYLVGREWRRVNKVGRHFGTTATKPGVK